MKYKISILLIVLFGMGGMYSMDQVPDFSTDYVLEKEYQFNELNKDDVVNYMAVKMVQYKSPDVDPIMISLVRSEIYHCDELIRHTNKELQRIEVVDKNFLDSLQLYRELNCT